MIAYNVDMYRASNSFGWSVTALALQIVCSGFLFLFLLETIRWRMAIQAFWSRHISKLSFELPAPVKTFLTLGFVALMLLEFEGVCQFLYQITRYRRSPRGSELIFLINVAVYAVYLSLWIFAMAREILLAEAAARAALKLTAPEEIDAQI